MTDLPEGTVRLNINMEQSLHRRFKAVCAISGQRMTDVMLRLIEIYIDEHSSASSPKKVKKK
ncbi:MAG TPA: plasmid partition protein ParG [Candidatus Acidoferrales bacterium]|nr:plasmid partition protein ParG [Candidatus Acidoferrales bacterium]